MCIPMCGGGIHIYDYYSAELDHFRNLTKMVWYTYIYDYYSNLTTPIISAIPVISDSGMSNGG